MTSLAAKCIGTCALLFCVQPLGDASLASDSPADHDFQVRPHTAPLPLVEGWPRLYTMDFGRDGADLAPDALAYDVSKSIRYAAWRGGMVRAVSRASLLDPLTHDFVEGEDAVLVLATDSTSLPVRCVLTLGDSDSPRGPVRLIVQEQQSSEIRTERGEFVDVEFLATPKRGTIEIHLVTQGCASFALCAATVYAPVTRNLFELPGVVATALLDTIRTPRNQVSSKHAGEALRRYTDYLLQRRPNEGCYAYSGNWYESAYALRALLVGAKLLNAPDCQRGAFECLDRFVEEQRNDGSWSAQYFGRRGCSLARETQEGPGSRNLADVGTMALTLTMAIPQTSGERHKAYQKAAVRFAEAFVLPNQLSSGAFPNLEFKNRMHRHPYSVATGVQAANLAALYAVTGDRRYIEAASRAARFLCRTVVDDGRILFYPFDSDAATLLEPDGLGEIYYILEGLVWAERYADRATRREIHLALDRYFEGPWGIASWPAPEEWLSARSLWESSKRAGFLFITSQYLSMCNERPQTKEWLTHNFAAMCDSDLVMNIGVLSDPAGPQGRHSFFATGLAGLGMASVIDPTIFFPSKGHRRP